MRFIDKANVFDFIRVKEIGKRGSFSIHATSTQYKVEPGLDLKYILRNCSHMYNGRNLKIIPNLVVQNFIRICGFKDKFDQTVIF